MSQVTTGIGTLEVLTVIFVVAKLAGWAPITAWSWWWVLSPTLIPLGILAAMLIVAGTIAVAKDL